METNSPPDQAQILKLYDKLQQGSTPEPYIFFMKLDDKAIPTRGRSCVDGACCMLEQQETFYMFLKNV